MSWLFPGSEIQIDCPCLDCGEPISLRMRDGKILDLDPQTTVGYSKLPVWRWHENVGYA